GPEAPELLAKGMEQVLSAPDPVLRSYAEPLRAGMLELALGGDVPAEVADRAVGVLLPSLARDGRTYARFAIRRAGQLLARHVDDRARAVLEELRRAQPGTRTAERWLAALDARRFGRIALAGAAPARVLRAVALAGIALPDAEAERFLHTPPPGPAVTLADLDGARRAEPAVAAAEHVALATGLARQIVPVGPGNRQMRELGEQMARAADLPA